LRNKLIYLAESLGEPTSHEPYDDEDIEAFNDIGINVGLAIKNAMFIEDMNNTQAETLRASAKKQLADMADGISHQFHNRFQGITMPIGAARAMIELANRETLDDKSKNMLNTAIDMLYKAEDSAMKGGNIAKGILRFTRPEKEGYEMLSVALGFDLALEMVEYKHSDFGVLEITKNIAPYLPLTWANMAYLQDMFFIVLDNAYDAINTKMEEENSETLSGTIDISISPDKEKKQIIVIVRDDGMGMKPKTLEKVRNAVPYMTTKASSATSGFGAGIHMLRRFVEFHDGEINYDSDFGKGCTVTVKIPIKHNENTTK